MSAVNARAVSCGAPKSLFCLLCLSLTVSFVWYTLARGGDLKRQQWNLRQAAQSATANLWERTNRRPRRRRPDARVPRCDTGDAAAIRCVGFRSFNDSRGEWRVCVDGLLQPQSPCLAFSVGPDLGFDAAFALAYSCQVFNFHSPDHRPAALGDGLWTLGRLNETAGGGGGRQQLRGGGGVDGGGSGFSRLLGRLGATDHVVELLRLRLRPGAAAGAILDEAIADGSLDNVKQLLIQIDEDVDWPPSPPQTPQTPVPPTLKNSPTKAARVGGRGLSGWPGAAVGRLAGAGFCPVWLSGTDAFAEMLQPPQPQRPRLKPRRSRRLTLVSARFLSPPASESGTVPRHRNPPGSQIARPLEKLGLAEPLKDD